MTGNNRNGRKERVKRTKSKYQKGFAILEAVIILLIMVSLVAGSWYVWHNSKKTSEASRQSSTKSQTNSDSNNKPNEIPKQADPSEGGKYLVIKEWGVRFEVPEELKDDLYYGIDLDVQEADAQAAMFASHKLANMPGSACDLEPEKDGKGVTGGTGAALIRSSSNLRPESNLSKEINGKWYVTEGSNGGTCSESSDGLAESRFKALLSNALRSVEAIPAL